MSQNTQSPQWLTLPSVLELIAQGARDGQVTYDQINDLLTDLQLEDDEAVEDILDLLEKRAIAVVDATPDDQLIALAAKKLQAAGRAASGSAEGGKKKKKEARQETAEQADVAAAVDPLADLTDDRLDGLDDLDSLLAELDALIPDDVVSDLSTAGDDIDDGQTPVEDALKIYLNRMGRVPRLSAEEEKELAQIMATGTEEERLEAKNKLVEANLRLVVHLASQAAPRTTLSITDLLQEGNLGLLDAAQRYKPNSNKRFGSTATWWIRRAINRAIDENARSMKLTGELFQAIQKLQHGQRELTQRFGRGPSREELAEFTGLTTIQIEEAQRAAARPLSLDAHVGGGEDGAELGETLADPFSEQAERASERKQLREGLNRVLGELSEREREILQMRFGLGPFQEDGALAAEDVARRLGLSRERIQDLELRAMRKLRKRARNAGLDQHLED